MKDDPIKKIEAMADELLKLRDEAVMARALDGCEKRMMVDEATHDACIEDTQSKPSVAEYAAGKVVRKPTNTTDEGSQVVVNVVRGRTEVNAGRFASAAMPTDERNWELEPTPDPDLDEQLSDSRPVTEAIQNGADIKNPDGSTPQVRDIAMEIRKTAEKKMDGMQRRIDDQLVECNAHTEFLRGIYNAAKLGTCVIKGPFIIPQLKAKWKEAKDSEGAAWSQETEEVLSPILKSISPWACFPSPGCGNDQTKMSYHWEKGTITPSELRNLTRTKAPGYLRSQIIKVLKSKPIRTKITTEDDKRKITHDAIDNGHVYEKWEYHGEVTAEALEAMGKNPPEDYTSLKAVVLFVNDVPIKAALYPMDSMGLIYHYWQWSEVSDSLFGQGIPRAARWAQLVIQGAWRAMMDNANAAAGGHLVVGGEKMTKIEKRGAVTVWHAAKDVDVREMMAFFKVPANQNAYQGIIEMALRFLDLETTTPMAFQGDKITMPETLGATNILMDSGNAAIENRLPWWEAKIMFPLLKKFYDFNMADPNCPSDIKGDWNVVCNGVKSLQNREMQAKEVEDVLALKNDPDYKFKFDWDDAVEQIFKKRRLNIKRRPETDIKMDEEKAASQPPPQDPRIEAANIKSESDLKKAQMTHEGDMAEIEAKAQEAEKQRDHERWEKMADWQIKQAEIMADLQKSMDTIKAKLAETAEKLKMQRELTEPGAGGQVLTPPTEPGQQASAGEAYQQ